MRIQLSPILVAVIVITLAGSAPTLGGTLCGTVRDGLTQVPVDRAGVFVFEPGGVYTGFHAATDSAGGFCIEGIPDGTYDLAIRVDDYLGSWVTGIVVGDVTGIDVPIRPSTLRLAPPWPNPARETVRLDFEVLEPGRVDLGIHDVAGRLVRGWSSAATPGPRSLVWDGRDAAGRRVEAGVYLVRLRDAHRSVSRRIVLLP